MPYLNMAKNERQSSFKDLFTDPLLWLATAMMVAGIVLCYFVWLCNPLCVICILLFFAGGGLWKLKLPHDLYYILLSLVILCIFPVSNFTGMLFLLSIDVTFESFIAVKKGFAARDRKELLKIICEKVLLLTLCFGLTAAVMLWLGALRRIDSEVKPGETLIVCFPYEERKLSISYVSKDDSITENTKTAISVKNTATGAEKRISGKGNIGWSEHGAVIMDANTKYLISLKTGEENVVPCTITLMWPCRLSDTFFKGSCVLGPASGFVKVVKTNAVTQNPIQDRKEFSLP